MLRKRPCLVPTLLLLAAAAAVAAAAVLLLPERWIRWSPAVVGAGWTVALLVLARRVQTEPGGLVPASLHGGVVACGLLTVLAGSWAFRGRVGWPELLLLSAALVAFGFWARAMAREQERRRHRPPAPPGPVLGLRDRSPSPRTPRKSGWT